MISTLVNFVGLASIIIILGFMLAVAWQGGKQ